ncbi:hypothetical protein [Weissella paramesenteroides]|uniref:hypothetical protein n=1 Tax=Weissella paramesenteroides TaxID=1249 RepID=UPI0018DA7F18|nr:hypothetical protein [Weissella paramesenteroides]QPI46234.1 hypothetical protein I2E55_09670 [Weissella paramesenteroides]
MELQDVIEAQMILGKLSVEMVLAIAGVEPVGYTNDKLMGPGEESDTNIVKGNLSSIDLSSGIPLYKPEQVRKILIKYTAELAKYSLLPIMETRQYGEVVDEFMESGE